MKINAPGASYKGEFRHPVTGEMSKFDGTFQAKVGPAPGEGRGSFKGCLVPSDTKRSRERKRPHHPAIGHPHHALRLPAPASRPTAAASGQTHSKKKLSGSAPTTRYMRNAITCFVGLAQLSPVQPFHYPPPMILFRFSDSEMEKHGLGCLAGRFSGKTGNTGETLVPEEALPHLAAEGITFSVAGRMPYEKAYAPLQVPAPFGP